MLLVRLLVISRLLTVKFLESQMLHRFSTMRRIGSPALMLFKGQLFVVSCHLPKLAILHPSCQFGFFLFLV